MSTDREAELVETIKLLVAAVRRYTDNPGCNIPARKTALTKLLWAAEEAEKKI